MLKSQMMMNVVAALANAERITARVAVEMAAVTTVVAAMTILADAVNQITITEAVVAATIQLTLHLMISSRDVTTVAVTEVATVAVMEDVTAAVTVAVTLIAVGVTLQITRLGLPVEEIMKEGAPLVTATAKWLHPR